MKINLFNIDEFIKANHCKEVTNPIMFAPDGSPAVGGVFDYEIFGSTEVERKNIFGYIDLHGHYIHPLIYEMFTRMGSLQKVVNGEKYAVIANKKIKIVPEDFEGAETGIDFIYDNFDQIDWFNEMDDDDDTSQDKKARLKLMKSLSKDEFFVSKWLVLPPAYRNENSTDKTAGDPLNGLYTALISKSRSMSLGFSFDIFGAETKLKIQTLLKQIYKSTLAPVSGKHMQPDGSVKGTPKNSMVRRALLGKSIDYSALNVITSPQISSSIKASKTPVPFGYGRFPLPTILALFHPFFVNSCTAKLEHLVLLFEQYNYKQIKKINKAQYSTEVVEKLIKQYIKGEQDRFNPIGISFIDKDGDEATGYISTYVFRSEADAKNKTNYEIRLFNITDLFYMTAIDITTDKHAYITRYPNINFQNTYPAKIKVGSTKRTEEVWLMNDLDSDPKYFDDYPCIPKEGESIQSKNRFIDVMQVGNMVLSSIGGDYDGDTVMIRGVYSLEANEEAERLVYAKSNLFNPDGTLSRGVSKLGKDALMCAFELTKDEPVIY